METRNQATQLDRLPTAKMGTKRLGAYLLEAGLLEPAQIQVANYDRAVTGKRFSEIVVEHGWIKQQTIDFFIKKIVIPEQRAAQRHGTYAEAIEPVTKIARGSVSKPEAGEEEEVPWTID